MGRFLGKRSPEKIREIYADLASQVMSGKLSAPVDTVYPIDKIKDALVHADRGGRNGKILVSPNGALWIRRGCGEFRSLGRREDPAGLFRRPLRRRHQE